MDYSEEQNELLKVHHAQGLSASQSATIIGGGMTRNAVIGKWKRMGMPPRRAVPPPSIRPQFPTHGGLVLPKIRAAQRRNNNPAPRPTEPVRSTLSADAIPRHQRRSFDRLREQHCKFPYGTPGEADFFFCGALRRDDRAPYCDGHCRVAYGGYGRSLGGFKPS